MATNSDAFTTWTTRTTNRTSEATQARLKKQAENLFANVRIAATLAAAEAVNAVLDVQYSAENIGNAEISAETLSDPDYKKGIRDRVNLAMATVARAARSRDRELKASGKSRLELVQKSKPAKTPKTKKTPAVQTPDVAVGQ